MSRYFFYDNGDIPARYEETVPQVFPTTAPGNFTWLPEIGHYVLTTFYPYQWDLNYRNPRVFNEMMYNFLFLANQGMDIIRILVAAYGVHVGIETLTGLEAVVLEGAALPLCERLDYFNIAVHILYVERHGALDAVQCIVESGIRAHKKRRGDAGQVELNCEIPLKEILDLLDSHLSLPDIKQGLISCRKIA